MKKYILTGGLVLICLISSIMYINPSVVSVFNANAAKRKLPIYCVQTEKKQVAISFDAAWGVEDSDDLLKILADNNVKATFFLCGYWVDKYPEEVKKFAEAGHDIGNHSNTHPHMSQLSSEQIKSELMAVHEKVKKLTGIEMNLFRAPYGEYDDKVITASSECGYYTIQWDIEILDIKRKKTYLSYY